MFVGSTAPALADKELPAAACNQDTTNAHTRVPETNGAGTPITGHEHIPEQEDGACIQEGHHYQDVRGEGLEE